MVCACSVEQVADSTQIQIKEYEVAGREMHIPDAYTRFAHSSVGIDSGFIQMWYPGDAPLPGEPGDLFDQGEWDKNIRLLFSHAPKAVPQKTLNHMIDHHGADTLVGKEYGLEHYSQSDEYERIFRRDVWVVDKEEGSWISCSKKQGDDDFIQLCSHNFYVGDMSMKITYNKIHLPEWQKIHENVVALYDSFSSSETARAYVAKFYQ